MKKFLLLSIVFSCSIIITLIIGEFIVRTIPNPYKTKNEWMLKNADKVNTIVLGSSHTYFGIRPEFIDSMYNLANTSQNLKYDYFILEKYGNLCSNLKTVILPISYFTFFTKGFENGNSWYYATYYKIYMNCSFHSNFSKYNAEVFHPSVYFGKLKSWLLGINNNTCDSLGWGLNYSLEKKKQSWDNTASTEAAKRHTAENWNYLSDNHSYLDKIISYCKARNIRLVFITTPTWHTYNEKLDKKQLDKMYDIIYSYTDIEYHDYLKDNRFAEDDFYDGDHLSDVGAKKFTLILKNEILE